MYWTTYCSSTWELRRGYLSCDIAQRSTSGSHRVICGTDAVSVIVRRFSITKRKIYRQKQSTFSTSMFILLRQPQCMQKCLKDKRSSSQLHYCTTPRRRGVAHTQRMLAQNHNEWSIRFADWMWRDIIICFETSFSQRVPSTDTPHGWLHYI